MSVLLEADRASFHIHGRALVEHASLSIYPGELVAIVGPNGAGKTTLVRLLTGEAVPSAGHVRFDGVDVATLPTWALASRRAVMAQAARLAFPFAVAEVVRLGVDNVGRKLTADHRRSIIDGALQAADVSSLAGRLYQTLSGGEQQRVQFARALAQLRAGRATTLRQVLFLDEPVASLDLNHQLALMEAASREAAQGAGVVAILHDLNLAATFADRLLVMSQARIVANGPPREILTRELVKSAFGVDLPVSQTPARGLPFVLPQHYVGDVSARAVSVADVIF